MQLPVDMNALVDEMSNIDTASETSVGVSVYIDDAAPSELVAHVRNAFASSSPNVRMTVTYLDETFAPHPTDDMAVIVAGPSALAGQGAAAVRSVGVPAMVATLNPGEVAAAARAAGAEIPDGDIVSPLEEDAAVEIPFDEQAALALDDRMGRWIVSVCRAKRLAFAIAFPFMRRSLAKDSVQVTAIENAVLGLVPLIPGADLPIMTLNQAKMVLQIAAAYGQEMNKERIKELAVVIVGAYASRGLVRRLVAAVPVLGFLFKTGVAYGTTAAMGYAIIEYFEGGQDATGVANVLERATETGTKLAGVVQEKAAVIAPRISEAISR